MNFGFWYKRIKKMCTFETFLALNLFFFYGSKNDVKIICLRTSFVFLHIKKINFILHFNLLECNLKIFLISIFIILCVLRRLLLFIRICIITTFHTYLYNLQSFLI